VRRLGTLAELADTRARIVAALADPAAALLLEEAIAIAREIYVAVRVDGTRQGLELLVAGEGGEDVERTQSLLRIPLDSGAPVTPAGPYPELTKIFPHHLAAPVPPYSARPPAGRPARG